MPRKSRLKFKRDVYSHNNDKFNKTNIFLVKNFKSFLQKAADHNLFIQTIFSFLFLLKMSQEKSKTMSMQMLWSKQGVSWNLKKKRNFIARRF